MFNDYENEPYYEPSLADEIFTEYLKKMKDALTDTVKLNIQTVINENEQLKQEIKTLRDERNSVKQKEREIETQKSNLMHQVRNERLSSLMKDFEVILYKVTTSYEDLPKCKKCNEKRKIEFLSPSGKTVSEDCECSARKQIYVPSKRILSEFRVNRDGNGMLAWYKMHEEKEYDYYSYSCTDYMEKLYEENMKYEEIEPYHKIFFRSKVECQKYCDWLNQH